MYTGTMIEELIESVQRAEIQAEAERSFTWGRHFEQSISAYAQVHTLNQDLSYGKRHIEVA